MHKVYADAPAAWQMLFQDPATSNMEGIVDQHHDIIMFLIVILILVFWLGTKIVLSFHHTKQPVPERFNHHTSQELVWAILPSVIITMIALPSLTQVYVFDDLVAKPRLTVKVTGFQWAWKYRMKESVQLNQSKTAEELLLNDLKTVILSVSVSALTLW